MDNIKKIIKESLPYIIIILVIILIRTFIFTPVIVNGDSMLDTLHDGDVMILDKIGMRINGIKRFDIVVIDTSNTKIIKRVIALPGEKIKIDEDGIIYINGEVLEEDYGKERIKNSGIAKEEIILGKDEYFVLGDNRNNSVDSRMIGIINKKQILGYTTFTIYPFNRIGSK